MKKVFFSYKHSDRPYVDQAKSVAGNPNHPLEFDDHSLVKGVMNAHGHINRRPPSDPASQPVKDEIERHLRQSDKLVVIIGNNTHSSEWVKWEMDTFSYLKGEQNLLKMRHSNSLGGAPSGYSRHDIENWCPKYLNDWLKR